MSRIFIENLPKTISQDELEKRFAQKGDITDIQLRKDKRNAFIGYKHAEQAKEAVEYFNKTFIYSSKISVKIADGFRSDNKLTNSNKIESNETDQTEEYKKFDPFEEVKNDPEFEAFIKLQRNIDLNKGKEIWNDNAIKNESNFEQEESVDLENDEEEKTINKRNKKTFEFTLKLKGLPFKIKKNQLKEFLKPTKPISLRFVPCVKGIAYVSFKDEREMNQALIKHRGFIDGHRIEMSKMSFTNDQKIDQGLNDTKSMECKDKWKDKPAGEPISESGRIYVRNLSYSCTEDELRHLFEKYGVLTELHMPIDYYTKKPKGFAFVTFMFPEHAIQAFNELDKTDFQGRLIHLLPAHAKDDTYKGPPLPVEDGETNYQSKKSSFKQDKIEEMKNDSNNSIRWNTLFVRSNAVADIMSKNLNMNKLDLLTKSDKNSNAAVRMALGEAQIVNEIKQFLIKNNVHLESFERGVDCPRSNTTILVKNLPAETKQEEILKLFQKFGLVNKVILPPYGVTAIVDMQEPNEAKFAFKKLAYTNFKHYPLYLEWAPADVFSIKPSDKKIANNSDDNDNVQQELKIEDNSTIFVKNLNFETTEESFRNHFEPIGIIHSATIAKKKTPKGILSMGYGFVQFYQSKSAKEAIKRLQNSMLDGHKIEIKLSNRTTTQLRSNAILTKNIDDKQNQHKQKKQTGSKICVKNIPFEATVEDIKKIFSTYGQLKSVRIPRKLAGNSGQFRGFGFVDFVTKDDAKRAFDALSSSTHLYGRALVLEWAKDDSTTSDDDHSSMNNNNEIKHVGKKMARYFNANTNIDSRNNKRIRRNDLVADLKHRQYGQHDDDDDDDDQDKLHMDNEQSF